MRSAFLSHNWNRLQTMVHLYRSKVMATWISLLLQKFTKLWDCVHAFFVKLVLWHDIVFIEYRERFRTKWWIFWFVHSSHFRVEFTLKCFKLVLVLGSSFLKHMQTFKVYPLFQLVWHLLLFRVIFWTFHCRPTWCIVSVCHWILQIAVLPAASLLQVFDPLQFLSFILGVIRTYQVLQFVMLQKRNLGRWLDRVWLRLYWLLSALRKPLVDALCRRSFCWWLQEFRATLVFGRVCSWSVIVFN